MQFLLINLYLTIVIFFFIGGKATTPPEERRALSATLAALLWPISIVAVVFYVIFVKYKAKHSSLRKYPILINKKLY